MIRIGVLGTANIAERRMIPAILKHAATEYVGVAIATKEETGIGYTSEEFEPIKQRKREKAEEFISGFGGEYIVGYEVMLQRQDIDAVYIPLPPALHFKWIMLALQYGKHVISEKPMTISLEQTRTVIETAKGKGLALIENYGFCYHNQMKMIRELIKEKKIGDLRLIRAAFCFPHREETDFRYNKKLGGGALLDCGGYTVKAATDFLGKSTKVICSQLQETPGHNVDIYGSATLQNENDLTAQISFGMDNPYVCELEIWGSRGSITAKRAFTAPGGFKAPIEVKCGNDIEERYAEDDQFVEIIDQFSQCIQDDARRIKEYDDMLLQSMLVEAINKSGM